VITLKVKFGFKANDSEMRHKKIIDDMIDLGWTYYGQNANKIEVYRVEAQDKLLFIDVDRKEIEGFNISIIFNHDGSVKTFDYEDYIPIPDKVLKYFDKLGWSVPYEHTQETGQHIEDWF